MPEQNPIASFLRHNSFFSSLSDDELNYVAKRCSVRSLSGGDFLLYEGAVPSDIYVLKVGVVEILKETKDTEELMSLGLLEKGAVIGELGYLDDSPRSVSIRATGTAEVVAMPKAITEEGTPLTNSIQQKLLRNIALLSAQRLKDRSESHGASLKQQIDLLQDQVHFGTLFVYMIILFGLNGFLLDIIQHQFGHYYFLSSPAFDLTYERIIAWAGFIIFSIPVVILIRKIKFPIRDVLSVRKNLARSTIEGVAISAACVIPAVLLASGTIEISGIPVANDRFTAYWLWAAITPDYLLHSYIQELVARGIMQNAVQRFLRDERGHKTVMVSSLAFGVMHSHMGLGAVIASGLGSVAFGYIYLRHKNLVGVTIVHYSTGVLLRLAGILSALR